MSFFMRLCAVAIVLVAMAQPAEARRGRSAQELIFLSETTEKNDKGETLSVCILAKQGKVLGLINIWKSAQEYVLAVNRCETERYYPVTAEGWTVAKASGAIPADLPDTPELSIGQKLWGAWGPIAIGLLILFAIFKSLRSHKRAKGRRVAFGDMSVAHSRILEVMCQAAYADGSIDESELSTIAGVAKKLLGRDFSNAELRDIVDTCDKKLNEAQFIAFGKGLEPGERIDVLRAAFMVIAADGEIAKKENVFLGKLAAGLGIPPEAVKAILSRQ